MYLDVINITNSKAKLTKGLLLKYSRLHMAKYPNSRVNITFCFGKNKALPFIKLNGISETNPRTRRLRPYFFLLWVFSNPSIRRKTKMGKANLPNINMSCKKEMDLPAMLNHTVFAQGKVAK